MDQEYKLAGSCHHDRRFTPNVGEFRFQCKYSDKVKITCICSLCGRVKIDTNQPEYVVIWQENEE